VTGPASRPGRFTQGKGSPIPFGQEAGRAPRASRNPEDEIKIFFPFREPFWFVWNIDISLRKLSIPQLVYLLVSVFCL
jgi:hypothetical protein